MPTSSKPRRKRGTFLRSRARPRPLPHEVDLAFRPLDDIFAQLRAGEIDCHRGAPVFKAYDGHWCEVCPALEGWIEAWRMLIEKFGLVIDQAPLMKLRSKLLFGVPLTPAEVEAAAAVLDAQRQLYAYHLDVYQVRAVTRTAEIKMELERA